MSSMKPTTGSERLEVLDALRGFALFGILLANLYSFIGYNTYSPAEIIALPILDRAVLFFIDWFIEGKFYGIFSILFGVGFALQAERFSRTDESFSAFWMRRMIVLCVIGLLHMYLVWNGDILTLYAVMGMVLLLFLNVSNRALLRWVIVLLVMPLLMYGLLYVTQDAAFWGSMRAISADLQAQWGFADLSLLEMRTSDTPLEVLSVNVLYSIPRPMSYLMTGRYFHVLGLFLIGVLLARHWLPRIRNNDIAVPRLAIWFGVIGLVTHFGYAYIKGSIGSSFELNGMGAMLAIVYNVGATVFSLAIAMLFLHLWASGRGQFMFRNFALLGRMALTNYIFQNIIAILLFFGYGLALMRKVPFAYLPLFALGIILAQWLFSRAWLGRFKQGPLESVWRKLTYRPSRAGVKG